MDWINGVLLEGKVYSVMKFKSSTNLSAKLGRWTGELSITRSNFSGKFFSCKFFFSLEAKTLWIYSIKNCLGIQALELSHADNGQLSFYHCFS